MTANDEQYMPGWGEVRSAYVSRYLTDQLRRGAEFDRFLARVKRDAAREAVAQLRDHLARARGYDLIGPEGLDYYIRKHYPEETP